MMANSTDHKIDAIGDLLAQNDKNSVNHMADLDKKICFAGCTLEDSFKLIGCDNEECSIEWYHIECVGLTPETIPEESAKWQCPPCVSAIKDVKKKVLPKTEISNRMATTNAPDSRYKELAARQAVQEKQHLVELQIMEAKLARSKAELESLKTYGSGMNSRAASGLAESSRRGASGRRRSGFEMQELRDMLNMALGEDEDDEWPAQSLDGKLSKSRLKSGLYKKAADEVKVPQRWPHLNLKHEFSSRNIGFSELSMPLFIAGELEIIMSCNNEDERKGRLEFLNTLMYDAGDYDLKDILQWYAAWVREVELGNKRWGEDPRKVGDSIMKRATYVNDRQMKIAPGTTKSASTYVSSRTWFCSLYNRNKCSLESPHNMAIKGYGMKEVYHICGTCYMDDKVELNHPECSSACPHYGKKSGE